MAKICARALTTIAVTIVTPPSLCTTRAASGLPSNGVFSYVVYTLEPSLPDWSHCSAVCFVGFSSTRTSIPGLFAPMSLWTSSSTLAEVKASTAGRCSGSELDPQAARRQPAGNSTRYARARLV